MSMKLLIVAGDPSGDQHGADLIRALYEEYNELKRNKECLEIYAVGGPKIEDTKVNFLFNLVNFSVVGFSEAIKKYFVFRKIFKEKIEIFLRENKPEGVILIDSYGFNIHVAQLAKSLDIPVIYYISPQIWASRPGRIRKLAKYIDKMLVIFPFEEDIYRQAGIDVHFVGHPFLDVIRFIYSGGHKKNKKEIIQQLGFISEKPIIGILPGSRKQEIDELLPIMLEVAKIITQQFPDSQFILPLSPNIHSDYVKAYIDKFIVNKKEVSKIPNLRIIRDNQYNARSVMNMALVSSGSATLENACLGIPMIILYKVSFISYFLAKLLIKVNWIGMANIIAGKEVVPEFIQHKAKPDRISQISIEWLLNPNKLEQIRNELIAIKEKLGEPGASHKAAKIILDVISKKKLKN